MSRHLLDTCILLWSFKESSRLSAAARSALLRENVNPVISVVSFWEVIQLIDRGRLKIGDPSSWWQRTVAGLGAEVLPVRADHVAALHGLPYHHRDPFDRMLVAQALIEGLAIVTADSEIPKYAVETVW